MNESIWRQGANKCKDFTKAESVVGLGFIIQAAEISQKEKCLFSNTDKKDDEDDGDMYPPSMVSHSNFQQCMS
jgi:hypothetical protein